MSWNQGGPCLLLKLCQVLFGAVFNRRANNLGAHVWYVKGIVEAMDVAVWSDTT